MRDLPRRGRRRPGRPPVRPGLEPLEERCLLSASPWQELTAPTGFTPGATILLSNGNVLVQGASGSLWAQLRPDASGNYVDGTWPANLTSTMPIDAEGSSARTVYDSTVLPDGRLFVLGGEYSNTGKSFLNSGAIYDPTALDPATGHLGTWTLTKPAPVIWLGQPYLGDDPLALLPDGTVLVGNNNGAAVHVGGDLTLLSAAASATATQLQVYIFPSFPAPPAPFSIDVEHEIMTVTQVSADGGTWTVERGQDGTTPIAHGNGASVDLISALTAPVADATTTSIQVASTAGFPSLNPTTLAAAIPDATTTTIQVASTAGFPTAAPLYPFPLQVGQEMMTVTKVSGTTLTVVRGTQGTTAVAHAGGTAVTTPYDVQLDQEIVEVTGVSGNGTTLTVERGAQGTTAVAHANGTVVHLSSDYAETLIFNPRTDAWTTLPVTSDKVNNDSSFEESWVKVPGTAGDILSYSDNATLEYGVSQAQVYDPAHQTWTSTGTVPVVLTENVFSSEIGPGLQLPDGRVFLIGADGNTGLYDPSTNSWTAGPQVVEHLTALAQPIADTSATSIEVAPSTGVPATPFFIEIDQEVLKVTQVAADGTTWTVERGQYGTPAAPHAAGAGVVQLFIPGDSPAAELPDGTVIFAAGQQIQAAPATFFAYNPATNTIAPLDTSVMPADLTAFLNGHGPDGTSLLMLPTGQMLFSDGVDNHQFVYTPPGGAPAAARPTVTGVVDNGDGTYTLSGTQLNGISEGAFYGDDRGMSENYPLVRLTAADGAVAYARTFDWSSTAVATGLTPETTRFTLPPGTLPGTYELTVVAAGISSQPFRFTVPGSSTPPGPVPPVTGDVTGLVRMSLSRAPRRKKHRPAGLVETLTLLDVGAAPLEGPLAVVLRGLARAVKVRGAAGFVGVRKRRSPVLVVAVPGGRLAPGGSVALTLRFSRKPNRFSVSVFAAAVPR
jgi:hypothetical protein